jgi:extradiol dioxygenase
MYIKALGHLGSESPETTAWSRFGPGIFGLGFSEAGGDRTVYLRTDDRHHRIAPFGGASRMSQATMFAPPST